MNKDSDCNLKLILVEWGIPGNVNVAAVWKEKRIRDDPSFMYNKFGTVSFQTKGEMNSRTTQVFVNLRDNSEFGGKIFLRL